MNFMVVALLVQDAIVVSNYKVRCAMSRVIYTGPGTCFSWTLGSSFAVFCS
ncbi:hypothetical protein SLEP1_g7359 [Rubroshorea leprosula]|uniref:Uncharacterized protein n=1 Tax=Rubroshorea leprosula TaxID=152421 RepID=A0AAV5I3X4_9ROSI|nr:hypothetical protein SLEP1_g7359 [Rubroshorea leprosula]